MPDPNDIYPTDDIEPQYNAITAGDTDLRDVLDAYNIPYPDIEPLYNPATQDMADDITDS